MKILEHNINFTETSIILATLDLCPPDVPLFPEPRHVRAEEIWPDYMIDWLKNESEEKRDD